MGRKFFVSGFKGDDKFVDHALEVRREGVIREGVDDVPVETQEVMGRRRLRRVDAAIGLDSEDVHMGGDRVVVRAETPEIKGGKATGDILQVVDRYSDSGAYLGSYQIRWEKVAPGRHVLASKRRIFV
jgi:hypothetical protein